MPKYGPMDFSQQAQDYKRQQMGQTPTAPGTTFGQSPGGNQNDLLNPMGSPAIRAALQRRAIRSAGNMRKRGQTLASMSGLDPYQQRVASVDTDRQASGQMGEQIQEGDLQQMMGAQDFGRQNYRDTQNFEQQKQLMEFQQKMQDRNRPGFLSQLGGLAGGAAGAFMGGPGGAMLGNRLGGMFGGGRGGGGYGAEGQGGWGGTAGFDPYDEVGNNLRSLRRQGYQWEP